MTLTITRATRDLNISCFIVFLSRDNKMASYVLVKPH